MPIFPQIPANPKKFSNFFLAETQLVTLILSGIFSLKIPILQKRLYNIYRGATKLQTNKQQIQCKATSQL